jgi:threonine dehydrogenase-like Zn-dependent dehydrogenase
MIKPGTVCMIRGVPRNRLGHEFNGNVVVVGEVKRVAEELVYWIQPELTGRMGLKFNGCRHQWLFPFSDFGPETLDVTNKTLEAA